MPWETCNNNNNNKQNFKDAQLTKNVTKASAVTTILNNRHKAKLNSKQHCLQVLAEHIETEHRVPKVCRQ